MMKGNKGEWSEIYVFLKLLAEGKIYGADKDLNKLEELCFFIIKILRTELTDKYEFHSGRLIKIYNSDNELLLEIPISEFKEKSKFLLEKIQASSGSSFSVEEIEEFMTSINCKKLKAPSHHKRDITIVIKDDTAGTEPELGFSIKSQLGNPSTLLNAGQTTNFIYEITNLNLSDLEIEEINAISTNSKIKDRIEKVLEKGGEFKFKDMKEKTFRDNLELIDSKMPEIISDYLFKFFTSNYSEISDLTREITPIVGNKISVGDISLFLNNKIKTFLRNISLGMTPKKMWDSENEVTGGFIVVKLNGDVLCYNIYNRNHFEDYLMENTKFETASSGRHKFGKIYKEDNKLYFKLNLQIRFIS